MYDLRDGKTAYFELLDKFLKSLVGKVKLEEVTSIGVVAAAVNGGLGFSANRNDNPEMLQQSNPVEFEFPLIFEVGNGDVPMQDWHKQFFQRGALVCLDGTILDHWVGNEQYVVPIVNALCIWTDEFARNSMSGVNLMWLAVEEIDAGLNRFWKPGHLDLVRTG